MRRRKKNLAALRPRGAKRFFSQNRFSTTELHVRIKNPSWDAHGYQRRLAKQNQVLESTIELVEG
jgi:hypothetical protein